ncbi:Muconolactone Delta-isomerase [compost metagenome]
MLFQVRMQIIIPHDADRAIVQQLSATELALAQKFQHDGKWLHIWRVVGEWANVSIFNVDSIDELHDILTSLPLFPFMELEITPLCKHPAAVN